MTRNLRKEGAQAGVSAVDYSRDGRFAAVASGAGAAVYDVQSGDMLFDLQGHAGDIKTVNFSHDGARLVSASQDKTARVWSISARLPKRVLSVSGMATFAAYDPTGTHILVAGHDTPLTDDLRAEVERERIRYWEVDPKLLQ